MSFLDPVRLWLLLVLPLLIGGYVALQFRRSRYAVRFTNVALIDTVTPRRVRWRQHVAIALAMLTLAGGIVLFAKPSKVERQAYDVKSKFTVVLAIDVSLSMGSTDVKPTRLQAAEASAKKFLANLPSNFQAALVEFAGEATLVVPPTTDRESIDTALDGLKLAERTATGEGIYTSLDVIKQALGHTSARDAAGHAPALILLLSDGYRTAGRSQVDAAADAKKLGVPVYTVAVGTSDGVIDVHGQTVSVPVEADELAVVSRISGGKAFIANTPDDLLNAYQAVGHLLVYRTAERDATSDYLPYVLVLLLLSTLGGISVASRWP